MPEDTRPATPQSRFGPDDCFLGIFEGHADPAVALVRGGRVLAYSEEERHLRQKHAFGLYPSRALEYCLGSAGIGIEDVAAVGINWNLPAYADGRMERFYAEVRRRWNVDERTLAWQNGMLRRFRPDRQQAHHERHWRRLFGERRFPPLHGVAHHYCHAFQSAWHSPFEETLVLTLDGSGDEVCTALWLRRGDRVERLRALEIPQSLGWFYAAFTEYLGFEAYDGEYKVMGLAAYGRPEAGLRERVRRILTPAAEGPEYRLDPDFVYFGAHSWSERFTDQLVEHLGRPPRRPGEEITRWHEDLAYEVQACLEDAVEPLVAWAVAETGVRRIAIGGGVGLNIKLNSRIFLRQEIEDVFANPLCSDGGAAVGAGLAACFELSGCRPQPLPSLALGAEDSDEAIETALKRSLVPYERPADVAEAVADELARGRIVGWFQGRMEAGPRALGQRSILADPRDAKSRDRVNAIIKFREYWRPFCPSLTLEAAPRYFERWTEAPFMTIAFPANARLSAEAPAIVHVDGTSRVQIVRREVLPQYHRLLEAFERRTGVPVLLNTSFNVKGEPIVCTVQDALRTFWSTGLELLAAGSFLVRKPELGA